MKRILSVQDISCVGKCSLTVALPIISAMGSECAILPTAVLSTHTMFNGFTFRDLTDEIAPIGAHWKKEGLKFDAIYTGYLGSFDQMKLVRDLINDFKTPDNIVFIDPVMADNGKLYPGFTVEFAREMAKFCAAADVIVPNMTEACFMLDIPYMASGYTEKQVKDILKRLCGLGAKTAVLTGTRFENGKVGFMGYDSVKDEFFSYVHRHINVSFHGTGDVFSSTAVGALTAGRSLPEALQIAADYTVDCIQLTMDNPEHVNYAVEFERGLPALIRRMGL